MTLLERLDDHDLSDGATNEAIVAIRELVAALDASRQFLDPAVPRGKDVNGWVNTVDLVFEALRKYRESAGGAR